MRLSIPKPCHENWDKMTLNEQGAFCNVCAKTVVDFSRMSDEEVLGYFKNKPDGKTCGRFKVSQLVPYEFKVDIRRVARGSFPKIFAASVFIFFTSLFVCKSDTGQALPVKVLVDNVDTASIRTQIDTLADLGMVRPYLDEDSSTLDEVIVTQEVMINGAIAYAPVEIEDYRLPDTTEGKILIGDTTYAPDTAKIFIEPMIKMGLVAVDHNPQKPPVCNKKPPKNNKHIKGEVIMGDVAY